MVTEARLEVKKTAATRLANPLKLKPIHVRPLRTAQRRTFSLHPGSGSALFQIVACRLPTIAFVAKPASRSLAG